MRWPIVVITVLLALGILWWVSESDEAPIEAPAESPVTSPAETPDATVDDFDADAALEDLVGQQGFDLTFEAVASLPLTQPVYAYQAEQLGHAAGCIDVYLLDAEAQAQMHAHVAAHLNAEPAQARADYFNHVDDWIAVRQQLDTLEQKGSETLFAALYANPLTTAAFDAALTSRGFERERVAPMTVAESLSSAEMHGIRCDVATLVSAQSEAARAAFFQELARET